MKKQPDKVLEIVPGLHGCPGCKNKTKNELVLRWLPSKERYSKVSCMRCTKCGTHWDYIKL